MQFNCFNVFDTNHKYTKKNIFHTNSMKNEPSRVSWEPFDLDISHSQEWLKIGICGKVKTKKPVGVGLIEDWYLWSFVGATSKTWLESWDWSTL